MPKQITRADSGFPDESQRQMNHEFGDGCQLGHANAIDQKRLLQPSSKEITEAV